jgi:hypothetical protein
MSRFRLAAALFLIALAGFAALPASAQEDSPFPDLADLEGLQAGVSRGYVFDFSGVEMVGAGTPQAPYRDALFLGEVVLEFDTTENAAGGYTRILEHGAGPLLASLGLEGAEVTEVPLDDLGDQAQAWSAFNQAESTSGYLRFAVMQQEHYVFVAIILTEAEASSLDADALLAYFSDHVAEGHTGTGEPGAADTSSGGLWEFFPPADHELHAGLAPDDDEVIFPEEPA